MSLASGPVVLKVHALASRPNFCGFGLETCGLEGPGLGVEAKLVALASRPVALKVHALALRAALTIAQAGKAR